MADTKISALPAASALTGTEEFAVNQGGVSKKATATQVTDAIDGKTITGATVRSTSSGARTELRDAGVGYEGVEDLRFYTGAADEDKYGYIGAYAGGPSGQRDFDMIVRGPAITGQASNVPEVMLKASTDPAYPDSTIWFTADRTSVTGLLDATMGPGSVGTGTFRDSVDARVTAVAPTVTMTTGGVGTGAFRDAVDARANAMLAARMQAGTASSGTVVAATAKTVTVTFPTAFSSAPKVTLTGISSDPGVDRRVSVVPGSETTTQFQVAFWRATGTASFDTNWLAVKP